MHEISLVRQIFRSLEEQFSPGELENISDIHLKVGLLSNVEPLLMQNAYEAVLATERPGFQQVRLHIETVPVEIYCEECERRTRIENYRFQCSCGKPNTNIVQGAELLISGVNFK